MISHGHIRPSPRDSPEQSMRWMLISMHHYWWEQTGCKDIRTINELTQQIRKAWIEDNKGRKSIPDDAIITLLEQLGLLGSSGPPIGQAIATVKMWLERNGL